MKSVVSFFAVLFAISAWAQVYVSPYVTKDGAYVEGHYRSAPNNTERDNYRTKGNVNPYTGQEGTRTPKEDQPYYQAPQPKQSTYGQQCGYTSDGRYVCR